MTCPLVTVIYKNEGIKATGDRGVVPDERSLGAQRRKLLEIKAVKELGFQQQNVGYFGWKEEQCREGNTSVWETGRYNPARVQHG